MKTNCQGEENYCFSRASQAIFEDPARNQRGGSGEKINFLNFVGW